jgi:hypothetical protein
VNSGAGSTAEATRAIAAIVHARSFVMDMSVGGVVIVHLVYQGPNRVEQIEHGSASTVSAGGGPAVTEPETITKLFIDGKYYEATTSGTQTPHFGVADACPDQRDTGTGVLRALQAIGSPDATLRPTGAGTYAFHSTQSELGQPVPLDGTITVAAGRLASITLPAAPGRPEPAYTITFTRVNSAPAVTVPVQVSGMGLTCAAGSASAPSPPSQSSSSPPTSRP